MQRIVMSSGAKLDWTFSTGKLSCMDEMFFVQSLRPTSIKAACFLLTLLLE